MGGLPYLELRTCHRFPHHIPPRSQAVASPNTFLTHNTDGTAQYIHKIDFSLSSRSRSTSILHLVNPRITQSGKANTVAFVPFRFLQITTRF
jgi:hypothetical protein